MSIFDKLKSMVNETTEKATVLFDEASKSDFAKKAVDGASSLVDDASEMASATKVKVGEMVDDASDMASATKVKVGEMVDDASNSEFVKTTTNLAQDATNRASELADKLKDSKDK